MTWFPVHWFQVLIGILTILYTNWLRTGSYYVSSPYRYSNNEFLAEDYTCYYDVSSPYRYSNNKTFWKCRKKRKSVSSPYRYSNNCLPVVETTVWDTFQVLIGILTIELNFRHCHGLSQFQVLIGILTISGSAAFNWKGEEVSSPYRYSNNNMTESGTSKLRRCFKSL